MLHVASQIRDWLTDRRPIGRLAVAVPLLVTAMILVMAACSGVNDNGTQQEALDAKATRQAPPPTVPPSGSPTTGSPTTGSPTTGGNDAALIAEGQQLYTSQGCQGCHTVDGSPLVGPSWKGIYGHEVELESGEKVTVDDAYIHESIVDPGAKVVKGFQNIMPSFAGRLTDDQINALIAYIKSLQ